MLLVEKEEAQTQTLTSAHTHIDVTIYDLFSGGGIFLTKNETADARCDSAPSKRTSQIHH